MATIPLPWPLALPLLLALLLPARTALLDLQTQRLTAQAGVQWEEANFDQALSLRQQAAALVPGDAALQLGLAKAARDLWYFRSEPALQQEADRAFDRAAMLSAHWSEPHYEHALMYAVKDQPLQALKLLAPALKIDPNNGGYWLQQARYLKAAGQPEQARAAYGRCFVQTRDAQCDPAKVGRP